MAGATKRGPSFTLLFEELPQKEPSGKGSLINESRGKNYGGI
jgi:hypothetical protein